MKKLVMVLFCLFSSIRCAEIKDESKNDNKNENQTISAMQLGDFLKVDVVPTTKPERYMVYFSWPRVEENFKVRIRLAEVLAVVDPNQTTFSHEVTHDQNLTYVFDILSEANKVQKSVSKLVKVPMDLVFSKERKELSEDIKLSPRRVFFFKDVPIMTNGYKIELVTEELIAEEATIQTFPESSKAEIGVDGKTPGEINIKTKSAVGKLTVHMRGQSGGDGADGVKFTSAAAGGGAPGEGESQCTCNRACIINSSGGTCYCVKSGSAGGDGAPGLPGIPGGNAMPGGGSGKFTISIQDGREFEIHTSKKPGLPGTPGKGGKGQIGGGGGIAHRKASCPGPSGNKGKDGADAIDGFPALPGNEDPICIYIASEEKNDCL